MDSQDRLKRLEFTHNEYVGAKGFMEREISGRVGFDFSIDHMPGDGFVLLNYDSATVAPLDACLRTIQYHGFLSIEAHKTLAI